MNDLTPLVQSAAWLPVIFMALMGVSMLVYVVLDGFDLGVGMLMAKANPDERDVMVASIGPFWDANETWLVLGVGILLIAFPKAHGIILTALYLPVTFMLVGLILRGVAFDFRVKARDQHLVLWNRAFIAGSALAAVAQGWMLGRYVLGFSSDAWSLGFALVIALCLPATYALLGACWLLMKTEGELQIKARRWATLGLWPFASGMGLIAVVTPLASATVRDRWFSMPEFIALAPIPMAVTAALAAMVWSLRQERVLRDVCWVPFALTVSMVILGAVGLAYSLFPYVVMDRLTVWQAASSTPALTMILIGCAITVPAIAAYTVFSYWVFRGKTSALSYG